ncbi:MAG: hypothetical protein QY316_11985 [Thermodesulfobacteriota bacterium]|nr:MAG: hypothetical protein QY316_11985 [Thermodesulfobacteriota bacterium]
MMTVCRNCVLPSTFPGISFDDSGVCSFCRNHRPESAGGSAMKKFEEKFLKLAAEHGGKGNYDVLMAYSGGKDSTYTMDLFARKYGLRVLAFTFDNTFVSEKAFSNMRKVCESLGADHIVYRPDPKMLRAIFSAASERELYSAKTLERASTICTSCIGLVKALILRTAIERGIAIVGFGWSPGQAPIQASVMRTNPSLMRLTQKAIHEPLKAIAGDRVEPFFLAEEHYGTPERFPWNVHPLAFNHYDEDMIIERNSELGWEKPDDTDANSTNCLLNAYANQLHKERYGFHPYVWEIANMVRSGAMTREKGLEKIDAMEDPEMVERARKELVRG